MADTVIPSAEEAYRQWQESQQAEQEYMARARQRPQTEAEVMQTLTAEQAYQRWLEQNRENDKPWYVDLKEAGTAVLGGVRDAGQEILDSVESLGDALTLTRDRPDDSDSFKIQLPDVERSGDPGDEFIRSTSQFVAGFLPALGIVRGARGAQAVSKLGQAAEATAAGALADTAALDPDSPRLSQMVTEWAKGNPAVDNALTQWLAGDPDDTELQKRMKNALEGAGLGLAADGIFKALGRFVSGRQVASRNAELRAAETQPRPQPSTASAQPAAEASATAPTPMPVVKIKPKDVEKIAGRLKSGDIADLDADLGINLENIEDGRGIREAIQTTSEVLQDTYTKVTGGKRSHEAVKALADEKLALARELGVEVDWLNQLYAGTKNLDGKFLAIRSMLASSSKQVFELADKAATSNSIEDLVALRKATVIHSGIQAEAKGIQTEIARALNAMKITAQSGEDRSKALGQLIDATGGLDINQAFAERIRMLSTAENPRAALAAFSRRTAYQKTRDAVLEGFIQGLLSNGSTLVLNGASNFFTMFMGVGERAIAGVGRSQPGGVARGEAFAMLHGMQQSFGDALSLAGRAFKAGEPQDVLTKLDYQSPDRPHAISAEAFEVNGSVGKAIDFLGTVIRLPGRLLMSGDEFFKVMNGRAEQYALAWRKAAEEAGGDREAFRRLYQHHVSNPSQETLKEAQQFARHQTFTHALTGGSAKFQQWINEIPELRIFFPFVRTPLNLLKYTGERTPVIRKAVDWIKRDLRSGDPAKAQLAQAKLRMGQMLYLSGMGLALNGTITGNAPTDKELRKRLLETGWRPYSVRIGNEYVPFNRADPWGMFLGAAADLVTIGQYLDQDDSEYSEAGMMALASVHSLVTDKAYLQGMSNLSDLVTGELWEKKKVVQDILTSLFPYSSLSRGITRAIDPVIRETNSTMDQLYRKIPGFPDELPPKRDLVGEPMLYRPGWAMNLLSPVRPSERSGQPVLEEIARLQIDIEGTDSIRSMGNTELTLDQRDYISKEWGKLNKKYIGDFLKEPAYASMTDGERALVIERMLRKFKDTARRKATAEFPELVEAYAEEKRQEALLISQEDRTPFFNF